MRKTEKSIKDALDVASIKSEVKPIINTKEIFKHPATKIIITGIVVYGFLRVSKYYISAFSGLVKAVKDAKSSLNG
ncbi:hypothetical protein KORDIASMS9_01803 [Kordia sp. SMS9]|uniref:hypothetical protein n=1 Tax=Kordia sp. SMS9 TaxID=2282170 RepID=UPI000E0D3CAA|nr:hypothetical protein [Kordia sp. SMS9]AXG69580.1 hypothetical protein KORDIASMS9_01803 [Kordia sp. SMS9]